jgi:hypothetical protein
MPLLTNNFVASKYPVPPRTELMVKPTDEIRGGHSSTLVHWDARREKPFSINTRVEKLIQEYAQLQENWDGDGALGISGEVVRQAKRLVRLLQTHSQPIFHAAPGPNGEIMLDLRNHQIQRSAEIIFYPNQAVIVFFADNEQARQEGFDFNKLPGILEWLNQTQLA